MKLTVLTVLLVNQAYGYVKIYEIQKFENCQGDQPVISHFELNNDTALPNKISFGGYLEVTGKIPGPLEMSIDANRCDFAMKKCEKFSSLKVPEVCDIITSKNGIISEVLKTFEPPISCPWMPGKNVAKNSVLDLTPVAGFPTSGFTWVLTMKGVSGEGMNKKRVFCLVLEVKISKIREEKKKN